MNSTLWTMLFAALMAGAVAVMPTILVGLLTDGTRRTCRDRSAWLPGFRRPCLAMQRNARVQRTDWIGR